MNMNGFSVIGRYCATEQTLWMTMSACTVAFKVKGAAFCRLKLAGDDSATHPEKVNHRAKFAVYLDEQPVCVEMMDAAEKTVTVFENGDGLEHVVRLTKQSESTSSFLGFRGIETDGTTEKVPGKKRKLVVIGDSITCGYGVEGQLGEVFMTSTENAEKAYGCLTAKALDAEVNLVSFSGFGIISGWTDTGDINETCLVPPYYEKTGLLDFRLEDGSKAEDHAWNFDLFRPDWIVVNLGTNDQSYCKEDSVKKETYRRAYTSFLKTVRRLDPQAKILCILGVMGTSLNEQMLAAVEDYKQETGDAAIRSLALTEQLAEDGYGTDSHPSGKTQRKLAEKVTQAIRTWDVEETL